MGTQVPVSEEARTELQWVKLLSQRKSYSETVHHLVEEAGYDVPSEEFSEAEAKKVMFGGDQDE